MAPCPSCGHDGSSGTECARCGASLAGPPTRDREEVDRRIAEAGPLELDPQWVAARAAKSARPPRGKLVALIAALVAVGLVAAAVVVLYQRSSVKPPRATGAGVSIRIVATPPVEVTIDGTRAGKTPLVLSRPISTTPIIVAAPGRVKQVVPDHDQTVDLSSRD